MVQGRLVAGKPVLRDFATPPARAVCRRLQNVNLVTARRVRAT